MYYTVIKHSGHLRTLEKCRKHEPQASVFYIPLEFSNDHRVLSQYNTRLRLLYLLNKKKTGIREEIVKRIINKYIMLELLILSKIKLVKCFCKVVRFLVGLLLIDEGISFQ